MEEAKAISVEEVIALVEYIAKNLVDEPDQVKVEVKHSENAETSDRPETEQAEENAETKSSESDENLVTIELTVAKDDTGKVIGKQGRIAKAIRTVVRAATVKGDTRYRIDIM